MENKVSISCRGISERKIINLIMNIYGGVGLIIKCMVEQKECQVCQVRMNRTVISCQATSGNTMIGVGVSRNFQVWKIRWSTI